MPVSTQNRSLSDTALEILRARYLQRDEHGEVIETPEAMFERVAKAIAEPARAYGDDVNFWEARFLERTAPARISAQLADAHERRLAQRPARRLFRAADRRRSRLDLYSA